MEQLLNTVKCGSNLMLTLGFKNNYATLLGFRKSDLDNRRHFVEAGCIKVQYGQFVDYKCGGWEARRRWMPERYLHLSIHSRKLFHQRNHYKLFPELNHCRVSYYPFAVASSNLLYRAKVWGCRQCVFVVECIHTGLLATLYTAGGPRQRSGPDRKCTVITLDEGWW
jgi:hypothetical protein